MRKFRIEECSNGWIVTIQKGKDEFVGRYAFTTDSDILSWLSNAMVVPLPGPHPDLTPRPSRHRQDCTCEECVGVVE